MSIWEEYFENAHISCLHYLVNRKLHWSERLFWLVTIVICTGGTYYVVSTSIQDYRIQKANFRVDTNYLDWDNYFPSVVICEKNGKTKAMEKKKLAMFGTKVPYESGEVLHALDMAFYAPPRFGEQMKTCLDHPSQCVTGNYSIYMRKFRSTCSDILSYCAFNERSFDCCNEFLPVETSYGICFGFNNLAGRKPDGQRMETINWIIPRARANLTLESKTHFLILTILGPNVVPTTRNTRLQIADSGSTNFFPNSIHDVYVKVEVTHLVENRYKTTQAVLIKALNESKFVCFTSDILTITNSTRSFLVLTVHFIDTIKGSFVLQNISLCAQKLSQETITLGEDEDLDIDRKQCRFPYENYLKHFEFYTQSNCEIECFIEAQRKFCHCAAHVFPRIENHEECNLTGILCTHGNEDIEKYMEMCPCLPDCNTTDVFKVGYIYTKIKEKRFKWYAKGTTIRFNIIVPTSTLRYIRYDVTTKLDLIVKIGGALGFFLGCSFLSLIQLLYYFPVRSIIDYYKMKTEQQKTEKDRKMDEYFSVAKQKLRLKDVEDCIRRNLQKKAKHYQNDSFDIIY